MWCSASVQFILENWFLWNACRCGRHIIIIRMWNVMWRCNRLHFGSCLGYIIHGCWIDDRFPWRWFRRRLNRQGTSVNVQFYPFGKCRWNVTKLTSSLTVSKLAPSSNLLFSFANNLWAFALSSFGWGVFWRTNGVSLSMIPESSENLTECVRDASLSSHPSESLLSSSPCAPVFCGWNEKTKKKQNQMVRTQ